MGKTQLIVILVAATLSTTALLVGIVYFVYMYRQRQAAFDRELVLLQQQFEAGLLENALIAQRETMAVIGREIHDNVGQKLTLASLYVQQQQLQSKHENNQLVDIGKFIDESLQDLRQLSRTLSHNVQKDVTFSFMLQNACESVNRLGKCAVHHEIEDLGRVPDPAVQQVLLRVLQEFLQNSLRHAACSRIQVHCGLEEDTLTLQLSDNGKGFVVAAVPIYGGGLANIRDRVSSVGGDAQLVSTLGKGTQLMVTIKL